MVQVGKETRKKTHQDARQQWNEIHGIEAETTDDVEQSNSNVRANSEATSRDNGAEKNKNNNLEYSHSSKNIPSHYKKKKNLFSWL